MNLRLITKYSFITVKFLLKTFINIYFIFAIFIYLSIMNIYNKYSTLETVNSRVPPENIILTLHLSDSQISEFSSYGTPSSRFVSILDEGKAASTSFSFPELLNALEESVDDDNVKAVALMISKPQTNQAQAYEIQKVLLKFRDVNKPVYIYIDTSLVNNELLIASAGSERWVSPGTFIRPIKPIYGSSFVKGFFDKFNIDFIGQRMALYKDFIQSQVKYQIDQDTKSTYDALYRNYIETLKVVASNYNLPIDKFNLTDEEFTKIYQEAEGNLTLAFQNMGYINGVKTKVEFEEYILEDLNKRAKTLDHKEFNKNRTSAKQEATALEDKKSSSKVEENKESVAPKMNFYSVNNYVFSLKKSLFSNSNKNQKHIAYLVLSGPVVSHGYGNVISIDNTLNYLKDIYYNTNNIAALVIRVDSPGGSTYTGESVKNALNQIRSKGIPIIVSQGNIAASAGYLISSASDYIYSTPFTTTGSIGVVIDGYNVSRMLESFKVRSDSQGLDYYFGKNNFRIPGVIGGFSNPYPDLEANIFKSFITEGYHSFISSVYQSRKAYFQSIEDVHKIAQGHVWYGVDAKELGLVDNFGGVKEAIEKGKELYLKGEVERSSDEFSPGKFVNVSDKNKDLPVVFYNANYKQAVSSVSIFERGLGLINSLTNGALFNLVSHYKEAETDLLNSNDNYQLKSILDESFWINNSY